MKRAKNATETVTTNVTANVRENVTMQNQTNKPMRRGTKQIIDTPLRCNHTKQARLANRCGGTPINEYAHICDKNVDKNMKNIKQLKTIYETHMQKM